MASLTPQAAGGDGHASVPRGSADAVSISSSCSSSSGDDDAPPPDLSGLSAETLAALRWHLAGGGYSSPEDEGEEEAGMAAAAISTETTTAVKVTATATRAAALLRSAGNVDMIAATMARLKASDARREAAHQGALYAGLNASQRTTLTARPGGGGGAPHGVGGVAHIAQAVLDLKEEGVVRLNGCLPAAHCDAVRDDVDAQMAAALSGGALCGERTREDGFGGVLARTCRYDTYQRPTGNFQRALVYLLGGDTDSDSSGDDRGDGGASLAANGNSTKSGTNTHQVRNLFRALFDGAVDDAPFTELSVLLSDPGAPRQQIHPDNQYQHVCPCYTVFVALQDIDADMGPTVFLPRSNTAQCHEDFNAGSNAFQQGKGTVTVRESSDSGGDSGSGRLARSASKEVSADWFLKSREWSTSPLKKGDIQILDSMTLHAATANVSAKRRSLLYFTLRNPLCVDFEKPGTPRITEGSLFRDLEISLSDYSRNLKIHYRPQQNKDALMVFPAGSCIVIDNTSQTFSVKGTQITHYIYRGWLL